MVQPVIHAAGFWPLAEAVDEGHVCEFCDELCASESELNAHRMTSEECREECEFTEFENCQQFNEDLEDEPDNRSSQALETENTDFQGPRLIPSCVLSLIRFLL